MKHRLSFFWVSIFLGATLLVGCSDGDNHQSTASPDGAAKSQNTGSRSGGAAIDAYQPVSLSPEALALRTFIRENPASDDLPQKMAELYQMVLSMNSISALSEFSQEFPDFPEGKLAREEMVKRAGLESRYAFREGKIGEKYVPGYSQARYSTETVTIDGKSHTVTQRDRDNVASGYTADRFGYTAVYQVFNESQQTYVIQVAVWAGSHAFAGGPAAGTGKLRGAYHARPALDFPGD